jgi:hypothetical protein
MGRSNKLLPKHRGPYQVIGHEQSVYFIQDLIHNLRPFVFDPHHVNPTDVAQQNEQEFVVDEIIGHRDDHNKRSTMEFLVR